MGPKTLFPAFLLLFGLLLVACQPDASSTQNLPPTLIPFPTVTPGRLIHGILPTSVGIPLNGSGLANPATAVALANQPTPTPDYRTCPGSSSATLPERPASGRGIQEAITSYLNSGGSSLTLSEGLQNWAIFGDSGQVRADVDFTGEGTADVVLSYAAPDEGGSLLILGCVAGQYQSLYQSITGGTAPPQIVQITDMNFDGRPDILFDTFSCSADDPQNCSYRTQLITWSTVVGRFVSILNGVISSDTPPTLSDVDNDNVQEIVVRLTDDGDAASGPLRTGVNIYDWNGTNYTLSIVQLDPPAFQIQVVHEADKAFARQDMDTAISLYQQALTNPALRIWRNDEVNYLKPYIYYRLVLAFAYTDNKNLLTAYQEAITPYPDANLAPVYVSMTNSFWNGFQVTNNLHSACLEVQAIIAQRPEAVGLINGYGSRSPVYTAQDLCPF
ncbi:MAG: hypothetical protein R3E39_20010 [Anaerolineae bacterium]